MRAATVGLAGAVLALALLAYGRPAAGAAGEAELFGKPLRGLTPLPVGELREHAGQVVATRGRVESVSGPREMVVADGKAAVRVVFRSGVTLPSGLAGGRATVEGTVAVKDGSVTLEASGAEVARR